MPMEELLTRASCWRGRSEELTGADNGDGAYHAPRAHVAVLRNGIGWPAVSIDTVF